MKIWFDILTPKEVVFFEPMIKRFKKRHHILCTSRRYSEVTDLARIRKLPVRIAGRHGGGDIADKLRASIERTGLLARQVSKFSPDLAVSFCSPEAARISYGLKINHIAFSDSPHHTAGMKLTLSLVQKLLIPWLIPKESFVSYGIKKSDIIQYRAIDAASISNRTVSPNARLPYRNKRTILVRPAEDLAAYEVKSGEVKPIIKSILEKHPEEDVVVLVRYESQRRDLEEMFGKRIKIIGMSYDGKALLEGCDVFVGSGGTMTAESAMLGRPTISYDAVPNLVEKYLVKKRLIVRERSPQGVTRMVGIMLESGKDNRERAKREQDKMEDPYNALIRVMREGKR